MIPHLIARRCCRPDTWALLAATTSRSRILNLNTSSQIKAFSTTTSCSTKHEDGGGDFRPSDELLKERYDLRSNEDLERKRARLIYQSRKRGMLENGVILASFADRFLHQFDADQLDQYDRLINLPTNDWDIFYWATKTKPTPAEYETPVMAKLREHLKSKDATKQDDIKDKPKDGSIDEPKYNVLGKTNPDDIIKAPSKKKFDPFNFEAREVDLTNYKDEIFDDGLVRVNGNYMQKMTNWRKHMIEKKLRRSLPAPISVRNMIQTKNNENKVYTQRTESRSVSHGRRVPREILVDSKRDRLLKHHNFMQHLLGSEFTDDATDYDDEAKAWADMVWHRNYGQADDKMAPTRLKCNKCSAKLHSCDTGLSGYVPKELLSKYMVQCEKIKLNIDIEESKSFNQLCQRCSFSNTYELALTAEIHKDFYMDYLRSLADRPSSIICIVVDLTDFPGSIWPGLLDHIGKHHRVIVVGNKLDLLPYDGGKMIERVSYTLKKSLMRLKTIDTNLNIKDMVLLSARTGFGVESLVTRLMAHSEVAKDIHLIGCNNSGKSTLFNALLQSDISAARDGDLLGRVSTFECPPTYMNMLRFPATLPEGWEIELKKRRTQIVERDHRRREHNLGSVSEHRQESMPHLSQLINRLDFEPLPEMIEPASDDKDQSSSSNVLMKKSGNESSVIEYDECNKGEEIRFTSDHPLAKVVPSRPLSAIESKYPVNKFVYHSPSCSHDAQIHTLLTNEERLEVFPNETIVPRRYSLRPMQSILVAGLGRLDLLTSNSNVIFSVFVSKYLPIHVIRTSKADEFYTTFLGSPYLGVPIGGDDDSSTRLATWPGLSRCDQGDFNIVGTGLGIGAADIVLSSIGWIMVNLIQDQECFVRAHTPEGKGIFLRDPPLLSLANRPMGKKIRDTPLFKHPHYITSETTTATNSNNESLKHIRAS